MKREREIERDGHWTPTETPRSLFSFAPRTKTRRYASFCIFARASYSVRPLFHARSLARRVHSPSTVHLVQRSRRMRDTWRVSGHRISKGLFLLRPVREKKPTATCGFENVSDNHSSTRTVYAYIGARLSIITWDLRGWRCVTHLMGYFSKICEVWIM